MKLLDAATFDLHEVRGAVYNQVIMDGYGRVYNFSYPSYNIDPRPRVLVLGHWRHPTSGNQLVAGLNLNYLTGTQMQQLQQVLPQLLHSRNLRQRYWTGRRLLPQVFNNFYRTYRRDFIDAITPGTLRFGRPAARQRAAGRADADRQAKLAQAAAILQKQRERADQMRAARAEVVPPEITPPEIATPGAIGPPAAELPDTLKALQAQVAQQRQAQEPPPEEIRAARDAGGPPEEVDVPPVDVGVSDRPQDVLADLGGEPPPEELEQERDLPAEPEPEETIEGQTQPPEGAAERPPLPKRQPRLPPGRAGRLGAECRLGLGQWPLWSSAVNYVYWHDPSRVLTPHPASGRPLLEHGRGPVLAVYDIGTNSTIVDRAMDHAAILAEAGWLYDSVVRFMLYDGEILALTDDLPRHFLDHAWQHVRGLELLTDTPA
jgi:hypothetical protein